MEGASGQTLPWPHPPNINYPVISMGKGVCRSLNKGISIEHKERGQNPTSQDILAELEMQKYVALLGRSCRGGGIVGRWD